MKTININMEEEKRKRLAESQRKYYLKNKKRKLESQRVYRIKNKEYIKIRAANRYKRIPEELKEAINFYRKMNPGKVKAWRHNQRVKRALHGGRLSPDIVSRLLVLQKGKCPICKNILKKTGHHLDHIIPLARGGKNIDRNVQLTCPKCNLKKGHKDPIMFMREQGFLL